MAEIIQRTNESIWKRLTRLFRSGPVIRHKISAGEKLYEPRGTASAYKKEISNLYVHSLASYGQYERLSRYSDYCFSPSTMIYTTDGFFSIKELSEKFKLGERFKVYAYDANEKKVVIADAHSPRLKREGKEEDLYRVTFDDGGYVDTTSDHRVLLRDGTYATVDELKENQSLMPFYKKDLCGKGYQWIYTMDKSRCKNGWELEHRIVYENILGRNLVENEVIHHVDFNRGNNLVNNLKLMTEYEHASYHAKLNNKNKKGKQNKKHTVYMLNKNPVKRDDINFAAIVNTAISVDFNLTKVCEILQTDRPAVKRRLKERGFSNWVDFSSKKLDIQRFITCEVIKRESIVTKEQILSEHIGCNTIFQLSCKIECTEKAIGRRIKDLGYSGWCEFKKKNDVNYDEKARYSQVQNVISEHSLDTLNHKVKSVEKIGQSQVYNITVEQFHNLAVGCFLPEKNNISCCFYSQSEMEFTPEIASALDIYADESTSYDEHKHVINIVTKNEAIKEILETLFYDILNIEFNIWSWARNLCKYGDFVLFVDASEENGILNLLPIPINEIEREEGYDKEDPFAVRFRWLTNGNAILHNWQIIHFRLLGNDSFLPYGGSIIEPARRIWRQLILIEDAMLVYRIVRSPERRVFKIDVGNIPPSEIDQYMETIKTRLKRSQIVDTQTGRVDLRYNPLCLSLHTLIPLMKGCNDTLENIIKRYESGEELWTYSIDRETNITAPGKISWAGITRKNADLVRVHLDDDGHIDTTPDHKFMLRDGSYCEASNLVVGQALMPLYKKLSSKDDGDKIVGYEKIYDPNIQGFVLTHRNNVLSLNGIDSIKNGKVIHHVDFDKRNNNPHNLLSKNIKRDNRCNDDMSISENISAGYMDHKVSKVEKLSYTEDTGCITVDKYHNFAVASKKENMNFDDVSSIGYVYVKNSVDEDYYIPVRGDRSSDISTLQGGTMTGDIEDVQYIQNKLFAAIKIPKAYLGYEGELGSKATLAQQDVRFARTIERVQKILISELNKIAIIHLFLLGYEGEDLVDFSIDMANSSTIAEQQKLELWRSRFEIAATATDGILDRTTVYKKLFNLSDVEIEKIKQGKRIDKLEDLMLEAVQLPQTAGGAELGADPLAGESELPQTLGGGPPAEGAEGESAPQPEQTPPLTQATPPGKPQTLNMSVRRNGDIVYEKRNKGSEGNDASVSVSKGKDLFSTGEDQSKIAFGTEKQTASDPYDMRYLNRLISRPFSEEKDFDERIEEINDENERFIENLDKRLSRFTDEQ